MDEKNLLLQEQDRWIELVNQNPKLRAHLNALTYISKELRDRLIILMFKGTYERVIKNKIDAINKPRRELICKKIDGTISNEEAEMLEDFHEAVRKYVDLIAPTVFTDEFLELEEHLKKKDLPNA